MSNYNLTDYQRSPLDFYPTPDVVTDALLSRFAPVGHVWEPCAGAGQMADRIADHGYAVHASDIGPQRIGIREVNFLNPTLIPERVQTIITNPPYKRGLCDEIVRKGVRIAQERDGACAFLLLADWLCAATRSDLVDDLNQLIYVVPRIRWTGEDKDHPSQRHAWHIWRFDLIPEDAQAERGIDIVDTRTLKG